MKPPIGFGLRSWEEPLDWFVAVGGLVLLVAITSCRAPDEYRVDYGQGSGDGSISNPRSTARSLGTDMDTDIVTVGLSWDAGGRRAARESTLARLTAIQAQQADVQREASLEKAKENEGGDFLSEPEPDPFGLQEGLIGGGGLALAIAVFFRDAVGLFIRRLLRMKAPE